MIEATEKKNPYEGIRVGDYVKAQQVGCNISPVKGYVLGTELNGMPCLIIDTGERAVKYEGVDGKPADAVEVVMHAVVFGCAEVRVTKVSPEEQ